jgi:hypothetical protein
MRRLPAVLVALATAANLVVLTMPASAAGRRSINADPKTVRAGQQLKVFGEGCRSRAFVHIYLNGIEIDDDRADRKGRFVDYVEIPGSPTGFTRTRMSGSPSRPRTRKYSNSRSRISEATETNPPTW